MKTARVSAPLAGSIRCDNPEEDKESIDEYVSLPVSTFGKWNFYILRAKSDSTVDAGIDENNLIVFERNCPPLEGDIVLALDECNQNARKRYTGYDEGNGYYTLECKTRSSTRAKL